ncbi:unnamed protein product [Ceutorhynchus assimilis]|uniref:Uncharacterized protein n=1 Tax=Ceutorhynchus assimilis TaxID=467358 RepID=A0A9N9MXA7_9CUCU|nr:unnamed protein product [Ceutorhynchus assimilis]
MKIIKFVLIFLYYLRTARPEIIAYDCADRATELTKVSLRAVKPCQDPRNFSETNFRRIQLVQKRQYVPIHILTCQVTVQQLIDHCGMYSHRSTVAGGFGKFIQHIEPEQCLKAHRFRQLDLQGMGAGVISKLNVNGTTEELFKVLPTPMVDAKVGVDVLYEGNATLLVLSRNPPNRYVVVETEDTVFALKLTKPEEICAQKAWLTYMMAQVLSKLLYLEIAVKRQMADVIYDSIMKRFHLREKILQNRLAMAKQSPDAVDHYAITHILVEHGTKVECQPLLLVNFKLENNWLEVTPDLKRTPDALELHANDEEDKLSMPSISISPISSNGIYSKEDMESFQQTLLYPNTRKAVTNQVARRIMALDSSDPYYMPNLFSKTEFTNLAHSAAEEVWGFLSKMGNLFSICGFLYTIVCAVSYLASVVSNYFTIKEATVNHPRRRRYLLASLWNTLAHTYLYQLASQRRDRDEEDQKNELNPVSVNATAPQEQSSSSFYPILPKSTAPCSDPNCKLNNEKINPRDP